jgi:hypothetical protein
MMTMNEYLTKYPWLNGYDPYPEDNENPVCVLEWLPRGWVDAFGEFLCEDLDRAIKSSNVQDEFKIIDAKEKYGAVRIYCQPCTPAIKDVLRVYAAISETVCCNCGAIEGVKFVNFGWVSPYCKRCYGKIHRTTNFTKFNQLRDEKLPTVVKWSKYSQNGTDNFELDISETTQKIQDSWKTRQCCYDPFCDFEEWEDNYHGA